MLAADFARPVFLAAVFGAGGGLLGGVGQSAMGDGHFTGGGFPAAVRGGGGDGGGAGALGGDGPVCVHRGNGCIITAPGHVFVGGVVGRDGGGEGICLPLGQIQSVMVQRHAGNGNNRRFNGYRKLLGVTNHLIVIALTPAVRCRHGKRARPCFRRCAGNHPGIWVQAQTGRQGTVVAPCNRRGASSRKGLAVAFPHPATWQILGRNARRNLQFVAQSVLYIIGHRSAVQDQIVVIGIQPCPIVQLQALPFANGQIAGQFHCAVHGAIAALKDKAPGAACGNRRIQHGTGSNPAG